MDIVDLVLAILHHFLVFSLVGDAVGGTGADAAGTEGRGASSPRVGSTRAYGGIAVAVIVVGICRVIFGLKGWEYLCVRTMPSGAR